MACYECGYCKKSCISYYEREQHVFKKHKDMLFDTHLESLQISGILKDKKASEFIFLNYTRFKPGGFFLKWCSMCEGAGHIQCSTPFFYCVIAKYGIVTTPISLKSPINSCNPPLFYLNFWTIYSTGYTQLAPIEGHWLRLPINFFSNILELIPWVLKLENVLDCNMMSICWQKGTYSLYLNDILPLKHMCRIILNKKSVRNGFLTKAPQSGHRGVPPGLWGYLAEYPYLL